ncbi:MAG: uroporphyrinogen-III C-methyltransferase [Candidatus Omnitrophota bacterium]
MLSSIKIGSRQSQLAKIQVVEILSLIGKLPYPTELITFATQGDIDKVTPLTSNPADDFFTNTLDTALINKDVDISIHSAKDLPQVLRTGLKIFALTKSIDETDSWVSQYTLDDLPKGARVGTSSQLRGGMIKELKPDVLLVDVRGTIEERLNLLQKGQVDGLIIATCALKRLGLESHIKSILPWGAVALQGQLAVVGRQDDIELEIIFECIDVRRKYGHVYLVGAGPGDPQLITLKAIDVLREADCVFYDYLVNFSLLKYSPKAEHIYVGKRKGSHVYAQNILNQQLKEKAMQGKNVVRLKGGDPLIFGRGADEIDYLRSYHIPVDIIPGVSSATGIASTLGIPLTARGIASSVAFVSGHGEADIHQDSVDISIPQADTIVFLMGLTNLNKIVRSLLNSGWSKTKPIIIISNGTKSNQSIVQGVIGNIETLAFAHNLDLPALIIVGDTVSFYRKDSKKILLHCGTHPERYSHCGHIIPWPMIQIQPVHFNQKKEIDFINDFNQSSFVILTSPAAVEYFMQTILALKPVNEVLEKIFVVIGRYTAQVLDDYGFAPQIISSEETAQGLFHMLIRIIDLKGKTILFPRSSLPNAFLKQALEQKGACVKEWTIYDNVKPPKRPLPEISINGVIFTSPSTFRNFIQDYATIPPSWEIYAKGPVTAQALLDAGYKVNMGSI